MTETKTPLRPGELALDLGSMKVVLRPSLRAALNLSRKYGGFSPLVRSLQEMSLDAVIDVVSASAGLTPKGTEALAEAVYETGAIAIAPQLVSFVVTLANGGKPRAVEDDKEKDETSNGESSNPSE